MVIYSSLLVIMLIISYWFGWQTWKQYQDMNTASSNMNYNFSILTTNQENNKHQNNDSSNNDNLQIQKYLKESKQNYNEQYLADIINNNYFVLKEEVKDTQQINQNTLSQNESAKDNIKSTPKPKSESYPEPEPKPESESEPEPTPTFKEKVPPNINNPFQLIAVSNHSRKTMAIVFHNSKGSNHIIKPGDTIDGFYVKEISDSQVIMSKNNQEIKVVFSDKNNK